ncbi:Putative multidrug export ATP-binding/permease protein [Candidatus Kinetoplastibacterium sorsogonicusi]|uniref:Multidrug export ATP-binding/permease protein n=1 Tax=Candidatus Kinetoplastidibacterium kentomonadis TaxID=1576550 RepID=A0A3Q8EYD5_9PROT|nr:ABC transporter ATP-binding protein [Candidatus Kinetoplastibacterium sorsogonicusi]AWD32681.1 Putative multidrug export ATP-binding/permease protein [Candidatus Kinetoplastibacterium sorsogonicusi]
MSKFKLNSIFNFFENLINPFKKNIKYDQKPPNSIIKFYMYYLMQTWKILLSLLIIGLGVAIVEILLLKYASQIIDLIQNSENIENFYAKNKKLLLVMVIVILFIRPILFGLHDLLVQQTIIPNLANLIRWQNHRYLLNQSMRFFSNDVSGKIANRVIQTGAALRDSTVQAIESIWHVIIYIISTIFIFVNVDLKLIIPLIVWLIIYSYMIYYFVPKIKNRSMLSSQTKSKLIGHIVDVYNNIRTIKLFSNLYYEEKLTYQSLLLHKEKQQDMNRLVSIMDIVLTSINGLLIISSSMLAIYLWNNQNISIGEITLIISLVMRINNMSGWIMWTVNNIFEDIGTVQDGINSISQEYEINDIKNAIPIEISNGKIEFRNINFHYLKNEPIISNFNLTINPHEKIGLVGVSGSGKSTIFNLLLRLYDVQNGEILIDGQNIAHVTQESLRNNIGIVTQNTSLLNRKIIENLTINNEDFDKIKDIIKSYDVNNLIMNIINSENKSTNIRVGEGGSQLSGGQRQLIAIARVLIKNTPILLLDEATSALDSETEFLIQEKLKEIMIGKTVIAIAHRLSTLSMMDKILVLEKGTIIESGTHKELLSNKNSHYAKLWNIQNIISSKKYK